jgi:hypothetical protein
MRNRALKFILFAFVFFQSQSIFAQNQWSFLRGFLSTYGDSWNQFTTTGVPNANNRPGVREHCGSGIYNKKIWIYGGDGYTSGSDVWYYDINQKAWVYIGDSGVNGVYTDKLSESTTAHMGKRSRMASAIDKSGNMYIFGGETKDLGYHTAWNDFWKYNTNTNKWTWLGGSTSHSSAGSYGTSAPDWPRARYRTRGWFDADGNYWVFGGVFYDGVNAPYPLNDMWKYTVSSQKWTCETGDCNALNPPNTPGGVYPSTTGQTSPTYKPRARSDYNYWVDNQGDFWFYGGYNGEVHSGAIQLSDTWRYNPKTKAWTLLAIEGYMSDTSPGSQAEALCWLGNDGLPWMKLPNRTIWKFMNGAWQKTGNLNVDWGPPYLPTNQPFEANDYNIAGSQFTTFDHIKTDSSVYLFNGYGLGANNQWSYMGALWKYDLEPNPKAKLEFVITKDDFVPNGISPYKTSNREITITNVAQQTAINVVLKFGKTTQNSYSATHINNLKIVDGANTPKTGVKITASPYVGPDPVGTSLCSYDTAYYKSAFEITIPKIEAGQVVKVLALVNHCMANFDTPTSNTYSWNHWNAQVSYGDYAGEKYNLDLITNAPTNTLDSFNWYEYKAPIPTLNAGEGSKLFTIELGSGTYANPSNNQNLGSDFPKGKARLDITLPQNVYLANGSLTDIIGEYAVASGTTVQLVNVNSSSLNFGNTTSDGTQKYVVLFPEGQYLPIRRIKVKLRAANSAVNLSNIKTEIYTTFNSEFATLNYGWKPSIKP